ncbi:helix-turn-helix transcriptional regulator [Pantoea agglomerans]|uniref:helix-turn-helix transcriptional regulator n=1 Tax=Enterobacter agglomerans TaxID=549 RepID=UPI003CF677E1
MTVSSVKILRLTQLMRKIGVSRSTIYDWLNPNSPRYDANFPKQLRMGRQSVGWLESEIDEWLLNYCIRVNKSD